ncbi:MAG: flagellar biosynthesis anti-sigma factor FlgM [Spirochaetota bacterium]|nr:flagellar biosynthesis anti-sigma factor FlgM [Spirochaetota bacterium]
MVIDKIGNIKNIVEPKSTKSVGKTRSTGKSDSVEISSEAKKASEQSKIAQVVKQTPDIRAERVREIKEQIANGIYDFNDDRIIDKVAEKIAMQLLRK